MKRSSVFFTTCVTIAVSWIVPLLFGKYSDSTYPSIETADIPNELIPISELYEQVNKVPKLYDGNKKLPTCPTQAAHLYGLQLQYSDSTSIREEEGEKWASDLAKKWQIKKGFWQPPHCEPLYAVTVVVCVRDRKSQLQAFLRHMHPFLSRQLLRYRIVVVEQNNTLPFNRAKLFNIGFIEAVKASKGGPEGLCVIFHDVDLLPLNDLNTYTCSKSPRHMSVAVDSLRFELPYRGLCGGVLAITARHFRSVDGYSNKYEGWGGEDDDFCTRLREKDLSIVRFNAAVSMYHMMLHIPASAAPDRFDKLSDRSRHQHSDGLSSLGYTVQPSVRHPLMLHIIVTW